MATLFTAIYPDGDGRGRFARRREWFVNGLQQQLQMTTMMIDPGISPRRKQKLGVLGRTRTQDVVCRDLQSCSMLTCIEARNLMSTYRMWRNGSIVAHIYLRCTAYGAMVMPRLKTNW